MDKPNVVHTCDGILRVLEEEGGSDTCYSTDEPEDVMLHDVSQTQKHRLYDPNSMRNLK